MSDLSQTIIKLSNIQKSYFTSSESLQVLKGVNLEIQRNDIISIMGPSGSGKSTLLNVIGLLDQFDSGTYEISGLDVSQLTKQQMQEIRLAKIGFIFQTFNLIQTLNVRQNIELPMALLHKDQEEQKKKSTDLLKQVQLESKADKFPHHLSIGEQQRVAIARALVNDPTLILCDEPTGNLDAQTTEIILNYLLKLRKEYNATILIVTHNPEVEKICDHKFVLKNGKLKEKAP
ncbi:putative ABC transporter ATP-binding protein [Candidatus Lokiarchaeum ossiferum]|uniref:ABC transporter ATP-binding protein n=1 Tax=Candidatus Lokiarchaeum ossiferum TaxID=2951803 RepID=A0ABY6HLY2_9ARCH|nr:putative ABC transporter ATP-binding protein [Candidatus Lokiarchaeum sp. B-35]